MDNIGISQRDNNFYDFLQESTRQQLFIDKVQDLFERNIKDTFESDDCKLGHYVKYCSDDMVTECCPFQSFSMFI